VVTEGWLAALADKLDSAPLVAGWFDLLEEASGRVVWPAEPRPISMGFLRYADTSSMAVERAALEAVGGFTEELLRCSDRDLSWKLQLAGYEMVEAPDALVYKMSRGTLWERVVQAYRWGQFEPMLYKRYRDAGMRRPSLASTLRDVAWILITTPLIWYPRARAVWWRTAPVHVGRIAGCRDARCWYP
jgi:GT2 family glycosyltransferase